jgi:hypothetical protein
MSDASSSSNNHNHNHNKRHLIKNEEEMVGAAPRSRLEQAEFLHQQKIPVQVLDLSLPHVSAPLKNKFKLNEYDLLKVVF